MSTSEPNTTIQDSEAMVALREGTRPSELMDTLAEVHVVPPRERTRDDPDPIRHCFPSSETHDFARQLESAQQDAWWKS